MGPQGVRGCDCKVAEALSGFVLLPILLNDLTQVSVKLQAEGAILTTALAVLAVQPSNAKACTEPRLLHCMRNGFRRRPTAPLMACAAPQRNLTYCAFEMKLLLHSFAVAFPLLGRSRHPQQRRSLRKAAACMIVPIFARGSNG